MKLFALYLPQFYETTYNNKWWSNGFTEWTNVLSAKPLYKNHLQPNLPLNNNYYNLLNKNTINWQNQLKDHYRIEGFVYYHYYFCGKKLLEKPAENLLNQRNINQKFFFCWANHSWIKSINKARKILINQTYGNKKDWANHFFYLLPFFLDKRYEKINNKPLFMIYSKFELQNEYIGYLNKKCIEYGFNGIHIIYNYSPKKELLDNINKNISNSFFIRQPDNVQNNYKHFKLKQRIIKSRGMPQILLKLDGSKLYRKMIKQAPYPKNIIPGVFFSWDNTPRHGKNGYVITPPTKELFFEYMDKIKDSEYVIINAWNEWAEGMMLEPTEEYGYRYLEWIKEWRDKNKV